jgi:hypothetical protein
MSSSNIRVFVQWKNATVFAGEDVECTITFKNVAPPEGRGRSPARKPNGFAPGGERQRKLPPAQTSTRPSVSRNSSFVSQKPPPHLRGHRPALSLNTPSTLGERRSPVPLGGGFGNNTSGQTHGRSLSIISLGTDAATEVSRDRGAAPARPTRGHARSGSLQIVPGRPSSFPGTATSRCNASIADTRQSIHQAIGQPHTLLHLSVELHHHQQSRTIRPSSPSPHGLGGDVRVSQPHQALLNSLAQREKLPTLFHKASSFPPRPQPKRRLRLNDEARPVVRQRKRHRTDDLLRVYRMRTSEHQGTQC